MVLMEYGCKKVENKSFGQNRMGMSLVKPRPNLKGYSAKQEEEGEGILTMIIICRVHSLNTMVSNF